MALTHTWTTRIAAPGLPSLPIDAALTISGNAVTEVEESVAPSATVEIDIGTIVKTTIVSLVLNSAAAGLTVNTNTVSGATGQSIALAAGKSFTWNNTLDSVAFPLPITSNISKFFLINAGAVSAVFRASILSDV